MVRQHQDRSEHQPDDAAAVRTPRGQPASSIHRTIARLQATAGNAAVTSMLDRVAVQRRDAATGGPAGMAEQPASTVNRVFGAMWDSSVVDPLGKAREATDQPRPDYVTARNASMGVQPTLGTARRALEADDPKRAKIDLLSERVAHADTALEPLTGAGITNDFPDWFGGLQYEASVLGQALGGNSLKTSRRSSPGGGLPFEPALEVAEE